MTLLNCYNKGCGKQFDPAQNPEDACTHHPGSPVFHDAYKGWSCCNKKCIDFTEFLNIKGCTITSHNPEKPPEAQRYVPDKETAQETINVRAPEPKAKERPNIDTPLIEMKPVIAQNLLDQVKSLQPASTENLGDSTSAIPIGTKCKNNACNLSYEDVQSLQSPCLSHPGVPVFHEGLKYWSCCTKKTTEFSAFLEQQGCSVGQHVWFKKTTEKGQVKCRLDWFQTGSNMVVSIFAKKYDPSRSEVLLSPVRLKVNLYFPEQDGTYALDLVLRGIVDVDKSCLSMLSTKVEITLHKAEPGSWPNLELPSVNPANDSTVNPSNESIVNPSNDLKQDNMKDVQHAMDTVDLSDL